MQIIFENDKIGDPERFIRRCGYGQHKMRNGEVSYVKRVHSDWYPRFHVYISSEKEKVIFNLHLDQRQPVYEGVTAHAGEYDGVVVEKEAERIKKFVI
ncbi:MAG: hypothetical protein WCV83_02765 [Candidatus Magasanikbacteria bacterium]|jgi:hypothetical protein